MQRPRYASLPTNASALSFVHDDCWAIYDCIKVLAMSDVSCAVPREWMREIVDGIAVRMNEPALRFYYTRDE